MKKLLRSAFVCILVAFLLVSCATNYSVTYTSRMIEGDAPAPGVPDSLASDFKSSDDVVISPLPDVDGYRFVGWVEEENDGETVSSSVSLKGNRSDRELVAVWDLAEYKINYSERLVSGTGYESAGLPPLPSFMSSYTIKDVGAVLPVLSAPGFIFKGWIEEGMDESEAVMTYTLEEGVLGDKSVVALWDLERYTIKYSSRFASSSVLLNVEAPSLPPLMTTYTVLDTGSELPLLSSPGFIFKGWIEKGSDESTAVQSYILENGVTGDKEVVALWDIEEYSLSYSSAFVSSVKTDESVLPPLPELPPEYSVADTGAVLPVLSCPGYIFRGWIEKGDDEKNAVLSYTLEEGTVGDRSIVALWDLEKYSVEYTSRFISSSLSTCQVPELPHLLDHYTVADTGLVLPVLEKKGFIFKGWIEKGDDEKNAVLSYSLSEGVTGNKCVVALWDVVNYPITYDEIGIVAGDPVETPAEPENTAEAEISLECENRTTYTIEDEITFTSPSREGFTFLGWIEKGQDASSADRIYRIERGSVGEKDLVAVWKRNSYSLSFMLRDGKMEGDSTVSYMYNEDLEILLPVPVRDYYTFSGWLDESTWRLYTDSFSDTLIAHDTSLVALWSPVEYSIEYDLDGGNMDDSENPLTYTYETETFTLSEPHRSGYRFTGWTTDESVIPESPLFSLTFSADGVDITLRMYGERCEWVLPSSFLEEERDFFASFLLSNFPESEMTWNGNIITLDYGNADSGLLEALVSKIAEEAGFVYKPVSRPDEKEDTAVVTIERGSHGDRKYRACWEIITYTLSYGEEEPYGLRFPVVEEEKPSNPTEYTVDDETFTLVNPEKFGYDFMGWVLGDEEYTEARTTVTIDKGSTEDRVYTPLFRVHEFSVLIDLDGGNGDYPETFTIHDGEIALERPQRANYTFAGWMDEAGNILSDALIDTSLGRDYVITALWKPVTYSISYDLNGGRYLKGEGNIERYNVETDYTLTSPVRYGYRFLGWSENEEDVPVQSLVLDAAKGGDRKFTANWTPQKYGIKYNLAGGEFDSSVPSSYTIFDTIELPAPKRNGYVFSGWIDSEGERVTSFDPSLCRDQEFTAEWSSVVYSISYDLRGGRYEKGERNRITQYTVETEPFTLSNPVRDTFAFTGWVLSENEDYEVADTSYTVDTSKGGDLSLVATWEKAEYGVNYDLGGGYFDYSDTNVKRVTNYDGIIAISSPERKGYTFLGWVEEGKEENRPQLNYMLDTAKVREDVALKALWTESTFSVTYNLNGGRYERGNTPNRAEYRTGDSRFILTNPVRDGYTFLGWVRTSYRDTDIPSTLYVVNTAAGGDLSFDALWKSDTYTITYELDGGNYRYGNSNPESYTSDDEFTLSRPYKEGYSFLGWVRGGDSSERIMENVSVTEGTKGNLSFYAIYSEDLVALGEVTKMQKKIVESGRNGIPRPDWVIKVPEDAGWHYEKAYAAMDDFTSSFKAAKEECYEELASWISTDVKNVTRSVNSVRQVNLTIDSSAEVGNAELVEYWEDSNGGVWVLMRILK